MAHPYTDRDLRCPYCLSAKFSSGVWRDGVGGGRDGWVNRCADCSKYSLCDAAQVTQWPLTDPYDPDAEVDEGGQ